MQGSGTGLGSIALHTAFSHLGSKQALKALLLFGPGSLRPLSRETSSPTQDFDSKAFKAPAFADQQLW